MATPKNPHELPCPCPLCAHQTWAYSYRNDTVDGRAVKVIRVSCSNCRRHSMLVLCDVGPVGKPANVDEDVLLRAIGRWIDS